MTDPALTGVLVIDKAKGPTSHDVIASLRSLLQLRRIGHCGTLDPLASGVLVICLGRYTRLNRWLSGTDKEYEAEICLGAVSATGDAEGPIRHQADCAPPDDQSVAQALRDFTGAIDQVPPAHSAVKVAGVRSYKRARRGDEVVLKSRRVHIYAMELLCYDFPKLSVRIHCSAGTYIRSLAADLGRALGTGAYLAELRRLRAGGLGLDKALTLDQVASLSRAGQIEKSLVHPRLALSELAAVELNEVKLVDFAHGKAIEHPAGAGPREVCAVFDTAETLFGLARWEKGALQPLCVLRQP
ncbi:MAG: tRNA pseudouridine(55) synthase TruB [Gemmatimonadota bacterium]|nr:tRNA pseudouridine(55) synthase TruB [Gemmatimonadota bacterium]